MTIPRKTWNAEGLTGNTSADLDSYDPSVLSHNDRGFVDYLGISYRYLFDTTRTDATSSPDIIRPNNFSTGVWVLQSAALTGQLYPLPTGTKSRSPKNGLDYTRTSAHVVTIDAGNCMDSLNSIKLELDSSQPLTIPSVADEVYNLFLCDDGTVQYDLDEDGATLLAGDVTRLEWIGFVPTDGSTNLFMFSMKNNLLKFGIATEPILGTLSTSWDNTIDHTDIIPVTRIDAIGYGAYDSGGTQGLIVTSIDGTNIESFISLGHGVSGSEWGNSTSANHNRLPFLTDRYFKLMSDAGGLLIDSVIMAR